MLSEDQVCKRFMISCPVVADVPSETEVHVVAMHAVVSRSKTNQVRGLSVPRVRSVFQMTFSFIAMTVPSLSFMATPSFM